MPPVDHYDHSELGIKVFQMLPLHDRLRSKPTCLCWLTRSWYIHGTGMWRGQPLSAYTSIGLALPSNRDSSKSSHPCNKSSQSTGIHGKSMYFDVRIICLYVFNFNIFYCKSICWNIFVWLRVCIMCTTWQAWQACSWGHHVNPRGKLAKSNL